MKSLILRTAVLTIAAAVLTGCFVVSSSLPVGSGPPAVDKALIGAWHGSWNGDAVQEPAAAGDQSIAYICDCGRGPRLRAVLFNGEEYEEYELTTLAIGGRKVFAAMLIGPEVAVQKGILGLGTEGFLLGFYELKGEMAEFQFLDPDKVGKLITKGVVNGDNPAGRFLPRTLTGTPAELAAFLSSPEASRSIAEIKLRLRRFGAAK